LEKIKTSLSSQDAVDLSNRKSTKPTDAKNNKNISMVISPVKAIEKFKRQKTAPSKSLG